jgi:hypothetical protein
LFPISEELFMIEPRSSRLRLRATGAGIQRNLPTGKNFGGSNLSIIQPKKLVFSIVTDSVLVSDHTTIGSIPQSEDHTNEQQSPLVVEAGKILVVAVWFWCLIGANFCFDSLSTIVRYCVQDV